MFNSIFRSTYLSLFVATITIYGCKNQPQGSTGKSLDHFAGAGGMNVCSGTFPLASNVASKVEGPSALRSVLLETIRAVPTHLQRELLEAGKFVIDDTSESCKGENVDLRSTPSSCQKFASSSSYVIHINATEADIRHATVQSLTRLMANTILAGDAALNLFGEKHQRIKADVAKAYLEDVARLEREGHPSISLQQFVHYLPAGALNPRISASTRSEILDEFKLLSEVSVLAENRDITLRDEFYSRTLGEALDSYLCNENTKASLKSDGMFRLTGAALQPIIDKVITPPSEGFGLTFGALLPIVYAIGPYFNSVKEGHTTPTSNRPHSTTPTSTTASTNQGSSWGNWYNNLTSGVVNQGTSFLSRAGETTLFNNSKSNDAYYTENGKQQKVNVHTIYPQSSVSDFQYAKRTNDKGIATGYSNYDNGRYIYSQNHKGYLWQPKVGDEYQTPSSNPHIVHYNNQKQQWVNGPAPVEAPKPTVVQPESKVVPVEAPRP